MSSWKWLPIIPPKLSRAFRLESKNLELQTSVPFILAAGAPFSVILIQLSRVDDILRVPPVSQKPSIFSHDCTAWTGHAGL